MDARAKLLPPDLVGLVLACLEDRYWLGLLGVARCGLWGHAAVRWPRALALPCFPTPAGLATLAARGSRPGPTITVNGAVGGASGPEAVARWDPGTSELVLVGWRCPGLPPVPRAAELPCLLTLTLQDCDLARVPLPTLLGPLAHLHTLRLLACRGLQNLAFLARLPALAELDLTGCALAHTDFLRFRNLAARLEQLALPAGLDPDVHLHGLQRLRTLRLAGGRAYGPAVLRHLRYLPRLRDLALTYTAQSRPEVEQLLGFVREARLDRLHWTLTGSDPLAGHWLSDAAHCWRGAMLTELVLVDASLPTLHAFGSLPHLRRLELRDVAQLRSLAGLPRGLRHLVITTAGPPPVLDTIALDDLARLATWELSSRPAAPAAREDPLSPLASPASHESDARGRQRKRQLGSPPGRVAPEKRSSPLTSNAGRQGTEKR